MESHFLGEDHHSFVKQYALIDLFYKEQKVPYELWLEEPRQDHGKTDLHIEQYLWVLLPGLTMSKFHLDLDNQECLEHK